MFLKCDCDFINMFNTKHVEFNVQERDGLYCIECNIYLPNGEEDGDYVYLSYNKISDFKAAKLCLFAIEGHFGELLEKNKFIDLECLIETQVKLSHKHVKE